MNEDHMMTDTAQPSLLSLDVVAVLRFIERIFEASGWSGEDSRVAAENLVGADLAGHASHGIGLIPGYVETIKAGRLLPASRPRVLKDDGPFIVIDARQGLGQVAARDATLQGVEAARRHGIAVVNLINSHHVGRIGHYGEMVAREGFV